jgi:hypothetical protein
MPNRDGGDIENFQLLMLVRPLMLSHEWLSCTTTVLKTTNKDAHCVSEPISARVLKKLGSDGR